MTVYDGDDMSGGAAADDVPAKGNVVPVVFICRVCAFSPSKPNGLVVFDRKNRFYRGQTYIFSGANVFFVYKFYADLPVLILCRLSWEGGGIVGFVGSSPPPRKAYEPNLTFLFFVFDG